MIHKQTPVSSRHCCMLMGIIILNLYFHYITSSHARSLVALLSRLNYPNILDRLTTLSYAMQVAQESVQSMQLSDASVSLGVM
jgi:hypothetical protein